MGKRTHRELYPEQYQHRLVGKRVKTKEGNQFVVERVVNTKFGLLAVVPTSSNPVNAYAVDTLTELKAGDRIRVNANEALGTPAVMGTIRNTHPWGYTVHIDGDSPEWAGPIDFHGNVLSW